MKRKFIAACLTAAMTTATLLPVTSNACTRMLWNSESDLVLVGRNEDYFSASAPTLVKTPQGITRSGSSNENTATIDWTVKYGSIAAFANNRFPMDGMNEKGLTARTLYFNDGAIDETNTEHEQKPVLEGDHWVSYILDNFATVEEAIKGLEKVRLMAIKGGYSYSASPKHLSMADASGDSAIVEIQNGEVKIFHGREYQVMTNPPKIQTQIAKEKANQIDPNDGSFPSTWSAEDRYQKAQYWLDNFPSIKATDDVNAAYGFMYSALGNTAFVPGIALPDEDKEVGEKILKHTQDKDTYGVATYLQSISDLTNLTYRIKSVLAPADVYMHLSDIDFKQGSKVEVIPRIDRYAQNGIEGDISDQFTEINTPDIYNQDIVN